MAIDLMISIKGICSKEAYRCTLRDLRRFRMFEERGLQHVCCWEAHDYERDHCEPCSFGAIAALHNAAYAEHQAFEAEMTDLEIDDDDHMEILCAELAALYANAEARIDAAVQRHIKDPVRCYTHSRGLWTG